MEVCQKISGRQRIVSQNLSHLNDLHHFFPEFYELEHECSI